MCWRLNDRPIGHCNVNPLVYGESAFVHLHLWLPIHRQGGLGLQFFCESVRLFSTHLQLRWIYCEPYADNPAPNRVLGKAGFRFVKHYRTTPGLLSFEQDVNRWELRVPEE